MNYKRLIKRINLSESDYKDIEEAVKKAETGTKGEIALAITPQSDTYAFWELAIAVFTAFMLLCSLFPLANQIYAWMNRVFWLPKPWHLIAFYTVLCVIEIIIFYLLYNISWFDSLIIPERFKEKAVTNRAMRYFAESGVYCTKEHTGILIFVSYLEHEVRIIADKGLNDKIPNDLWTQIADEIAQDIAKGSVKDGFIKAIEKCGALFAENFPLENAESSVSAGPTSSAVTEESSNVNPNELSDSLVILED
jgi:putative membrane protein